MATHAFLPKITFPTRFTNHGCTLIDNFFGKISTSVLNARACILTNNISEHQPYISNIPNLFTIEKIQNFICVKTHNASSTANFKREISTHHIYKLDQNLQANPNSNYNILGDYITKVIITHFPIRGVKYNKHKHTKCQWITHDIIKSIKFTNNMYRRLNGTPPDSDLFKNLKININTYNKIIKRNIKTAKKTYYAASFQTYQNDIKGICQTTNEILNKTQKTNGYPEHFKAAVQTHSHFTYNVLLYATVW